MLPEKPVCKQCGTCCRKGGPALHRQDEALFREGLLRAQDLCAFRPDDWTCRFLMGTNSCFLYGKHPAECRALFCQAPEALLSMSGEDRLDRRAVCELIKAPAWWSELMDAHDERCDYAHLTELAPALNEDETARREFLEIVEYDRAFRELVADKQAALPLELDFLFGRPLLRTVVMYGLDARPAPDGGIMLVQTTKAAL